MSTRGVGYRLEEWRGGLEIVQVMIDKALTPVREMLLAVSHRSEELNKRLFVCEERLARIEAERRSGQ